MPFNGSGTFNLIYNWQNDAAQGLNISSSRMEAQEQDIAAGLSLCITKDGQQTPTANLPMGTFRLTNMGNATAQGNAVSVQDVQNSSVTTLITVAGTDTITANTSPSIAAYAANQRFQFMPAGANATNAVTLNINGFGAKNVMKSGPSGLVALAAGDIPAGVMQSVVYDGTQFQLQAPGIPFLHGQCRLSVTSTTSLLLSPFNGNGLIINGMPEQVPAAGISVLNTGLAASTLYYAYVSMVGGVMTLGLFTNVPAIASNGVYTMSGNTAYTLVGMIYTSSGILFVDSATSRTCLSWFNRQNKSLAQNGTNSTSSTTSVTLSPVTTFLEWGDDAISIGISGFMSNNTAGANTVSTLTIDGTGVASTNFSPYTTNANGAISARITTQLVQGVHTMFLSGLVGSGNGTWNYYIDGFTRG